MEKENRARKIQRSYTLRERFDYWFDNRVAKGSLGFIHFLIIACVFCAVLIAGLIILLGFNEEGEVASVFWDSFATVINAWMPSFEDGSPGYLIMMSIIAILGVLFTSVLIGIIITVEMQSERNQKIVSGGDNTDFLVSSSMSSLFLAQLAESSELIGAFREILSNKGNEVYLKNVGLLGITAKHTTRELRQIMLKQGYILLGYLDGQKVSRFNLPLQEELDLTSTDNLIVLGEN